MTLAHGPLVVLSDRLDGVLAAATSVETIRGAVQEAIGELAADGVVYAELTIAPLRQATGDRWPDVTIAAVHAGIEDADGLGCRSRLVIRAAPQVDCWRIIGDCEVADGRIVALGPIAAAIRDGGRVVEVCLSASERLGNAVDAHPVRLLFDAGFRVTFQPEDRARTTTSPRREFALAAEHHGFTAVELAACVERAAAAAMLPEGERDSLVARVSDAWDARPARLVHLAEREAWESQRSSGTYLPKEWDRDGFVHLSSLHQLLTPANRFYRGRNDLVALVVDAHLLGAGVVWESGTGTVERFPHLFSAIMPDAVLAEIEIAPEPDGGFLLPPALTRAVRSPLGR